MKLSHPHAIRAARELLGELLGAQGELNVIAEATDGTRLSDELWALMMMIEEAVGQLDEALTDAPDRRRVLAAWRRHRSCKSGAVLTGP